LKDFYMTAKMLLSYHGMCNCPI